MPKTPKGRALGNALRRAREDRGVTVRQVAARLERDPGVLSRWETGQRMPKPEQVAQLLTTLGIRGEHYEEIVSLAYDLDNSSWIETTAAGRRRQITALCDMDRNATKIIEVAPLLVPGLLQTSDYIQSMMAADAPINEVSARTTLRLGRQQVITADVQPVDLVVLLNQTALYHVIGGFAAMIELLRYPIKMAHRPNIDLRIIPCNAGWHPALEAPFTIYESRSHGPVVILENRQAGMFLHQDDDVRMYQPAVKNLMDITLNPHESIWFIAGLVEGMEHKS